MQLKRWFAPQLKTVFAHYADAYDRRCRQVGRPTQRRSCMGYTELVQFAADCRLPSGTLTRSFILLTKYMRI